MPITFLPIACWLLLVSLVLTGCASHPGDEEQCLLCHRGIEHASASHAGCVSCHGGNPRATGKVEAHRGIFGISNPSFPGRWEQGCGPCHPYQLARMQSDIMFTASGMIRNTQLTWEGDERTFYSSPGGSGYDLAGVKVEYQPVAAMNDLSGELFRKFCARCHVALQSQGAFAASHGAGCAACHFPRNDDGTYRGGDPTMGGKPGHSASHALATLPDTAVCATCHSRSGRMAYSYQGLYDGNNALAPTRNGQPGPVRASDGRTLSHIMPDVHWAAGMECIDCHTSRDVMGDGYLYRNMYQQTEIRCEDCHGSPTQLPQYRELSGEHDEALRESRSYRTPLVSGMKMIQTSRGRSYANVFYRDGVVWLMGKKSGKLHRCKVITGTPAHTIIGHERMECFACHSHTVVQCYGCHTAYDKREPGRDFVKGLDTPGRFSETEDIRTLYPFPLALNERGRISPVTPGCQTFVTIDEADGSRSKTEYVARFKGQNQLRFAPFYSHNTGKKAVGCIECHGNPAFVGFGQHVAARGMLEATLLCERSDGKPLDGFLTMAGGTIRSFSAITRENSRPLNSHEIKRTWSVNLCLPCHLRPDDPIYRKGLDYRALDDTLHRRLLAP